MAAAFDTSALRARLGESELVRQIRTLDEVDSTNAELRRLGRRGIPSGTVLVAERQTAGRGRLGRGWFSPAGSGLYLSILLRPAGAVRLAGRWTLVAAVSAAEGLASLAVSAAIKWPNDLVYGGRKLGGILVELRSMGQRVEELVIGLGINVAQTAEDFPPGLRESATSLLLAGKAGITRERVAAAYLRALGRRASGAQDADWPELRAAWNALSLGYEGTAILVRTGGRSPFRATARGLDDAGRLRIECGDGRCTVLNQADSVRRVVDEG